LLLPNARSAAARDNTQPHETDGNSTNWRSRTPGRVRVGWRSLFGGLHWYDTDGKRPEIWCIEISQARGWRYWPRLVSRNIWAERGRPVERTRDATAERPQRRRPREQPTQWNRCKLHKLTITNSRQGAGRLTQPVRLPLQRLTPWRPPTHGNGTIWGRRLRIDEWRNSAGKWSKRGTQRGAAWNILRFGRPHWSSRTPKAQRLPAS